MSDDRPEPGGAEQPDPAPATGEPDSGRVRDRWSGGWRGRALLGGLAAVLVLVGGLGGFALAAATDQGDHRHPGFADHDGPERGDRPGPPPSR